MYKLLSVVIALLMGITLTFVVGSIAKGAPPGIIESDSSAVFVVQPASHATSTTAHDDFDNAIAIGRCRSHTPPARVEQRLRATTRRPAPITDRYGTDSRRQVIF